MNSSRGFTLVELLVALSLMAIVAALLTNSMRFGLGTATVVESKMSAIESLHQSQRAFRRQVQLARPVPRLDAEIDEQLDFVAKAKQLEIIAPLPGLVGGGGLYRVSFEIEDDTTLNGTNGRLIMRYRMYLDGSTDERREIEVGEVVLLADFSNARFSYGDTLRTNNGQWTDEWRQLARLPDIVRLSINLGDADREELDFTVAVKAPFPVRLQTS